MKKTGGIDRYTSNLIVKQVFFFRGSINFSQFFGHYLFISLKPNKISTRLKSFHIQLRLVLPFIFPRILNAL